MGCTEQGRSRDPSLWNLVGHPQLTKLSHSWPYEWGGLSSLSPGSYPLTHNFPVCVPSNQENLFLKDLGEGSNHTNKSRMDTFSECDWLCVSPPPG